MHMSEYLTPWQWAAMIYNDQHFEWQARGVEDGSMVTLSMLIGPTVVNASNSSQPLVK